MAKDRYGVVLNDLQLPDDNVHSLSGGWELHKAAEDQLSTFKPVLERLYNAVTFSKKPYPPLTKRKSPGLQTGSWNGI